MVASGILVGLDISVHDEPLVRLLITRAPDGSPGRLSLIAMANVNNTYSLRQLFHERRFRVPDYQRGYSWAESNIRDFLDDLEYLPRDRVHYTGTIVIHPNGRERELNDIGGRPLNRTNIVDGQQRLTTAVILLGCIRRALKGAGDETLANEILKDFIRTLDDDEQPIDRLTLNAGTNSFFQQNVLADSPGQLRPKTSAETRLKTARRVMEEYIQTEVSKRGPDQASRWLKELQRKITNRLRFSLYEVDSEAEVGIIFEVMNDRGKPLTQLEMVKNYLLYAGASLGVADRLTDQVNEAWSTILTGLMDANLERSQDEDRLLRTHWVTKYDPKPRNRVNIHRVKASFDVRRGDRGRERLISELSDYITDLEQSSIPFSEAHRPALDGYFASFDATPRKHAEVVEWNSKLVRLGLPVSFLPLLMAVRLTYPRDATKYLETLQLCEAYAFRVWWLPLRRSRTDAGQRTFFRVAHELRSNQCSFEQAMHSIRSELVRRCGDVEFAKQFDERVEAAQWYRWRGLKYVLYEYEVHLSEQTKAIPEVSWEELIPLDHTSTIEHVLPQTIESVPYWTDRFSEEDHRQYLHDIGNLTLSRYNESLSNRPFPEKKGQAREPERYINSSFCQERDLVHYEDWTPETIVERRECIINWAKQRWSIDLSDASDDRDEVDEDDIDDLSDE